MFLRPLRKLLPEPLPKIPLRWVLIVPFVLQTVGAVSVVGYLSYRSGQESVRMMADRLVSEADGRVRDHLENYLQKPLQTVQINARAVKRGNLDIKNRQEIKNYLWQQINLSPGLTTNQFTDSRGDEIYYARLDNRKFVELVRRLTGERLPLDTIIYGEVKNTEPGIRKYYLVTERGEPRKLIYTFKIDNRTTPWFLHARSMDKPGWSPVYVTRVATTLSLAALAPLRNGKGEFRGLFFSGLQLLDIGAFLEKLNFSPSGSVFIVDRSGDIVATSSGEIPFIKPEKGRPRRLAAIDSRDPRTRSIARQLLQKYGGFNAIPDGTILNLPVNRQKQFTRVNSYRDRNGLDWITIVTVPESDFMTGIEANNRRTIALCGLTLLVSTVLGLWTARAIARPIGNLNDASRILAAGNWRKEPRPEIAIDELETLTRSFESMALQLQESLDRTKLALSRSEEKFAKIFRSSPDAIAIVSLETGKYLAVNDRFTDRTGYFPEEAIGRTAGELGLVVDPERECGIDRLVRQYGGFRDHEMEWRARSGEIRIGSFSGEPIELEGQPCLLLVFRDYSDRQRAERALREAQRIAHIGSWEFDTLTEEIFWSEELYRIHDLDPLLPPPSARIMATKIIHPDDRPLYWDFVERLRRGETVEEDLRIVRADGSIRYISTRGEAILDPTGKPIRLVGTVLDITDRKQVELELIRSRDELQKKENRLQTLAEALPGVLYTVVEGLNGPSGFEYLSPAFEEVHEIPAREVMENASVLSEQFHPDDREDYKRAVIESLKTMSPFVHEWRIITRSGQIKWLQANSQPERRANGDIVWHGFVQDITDRKNLELALQDSEARLKDILDNANVILSSMRVFADGRWIIDHVSAAAEKIVGFTTEELTADNNLWTSRVEREDWERILPDVLESIYACRPTVHEYRINHKDGSQRWIAQATNSRRDEEQDCWVVTNASSDVSERHAIERVKDEFISVVSHELRTPLTALKGALGLLNARVLETNPDTDREMLALAARNCDRLAALVNDILDLERLESGRVELTRELCEVTDVIEQAIDSVSILARNAGITIVGSPIVATFTGDRQAIVQTLTNLLGNAIKFSPAGSTVSVKARRIDREPAKDFPTPCILFSVEDRGRGIPSDKLEAIFGRFQQVDISDARQKGGTGLGLAICKSIVTRHGGEIWTESTVGRGSIFYFTVAIATV